MRMKPCPSTRRSACTSWMRLPVWGEDDVRGSLSPEKYADIIVLDLDRTSVQVDEIRYLAVDFVMSLGRVIRAAEQARWHKRT